MTIPCTPETCKPVPAVPVTPQELFGYLSWGLMSLSVFGLLAVAMKVVIAHNRREPADGNWIIVVGLVILGLLPGAVALPWSDLDWDAIGSVILGVGIGIGILVAMAALAGLIWLLTRRSAQRKAEALETAEQVALNTELSLLAQVNMLAGMKSDGAKTDADWLAEQMKIAGIGGK